MRSLVVSMVLLVAATVVHAGYGAGDPRLSRLYSSFMAPCCYGGDLTLHTSPTADELRAEIAAWVKEGRTDEEIHAAIVGRYGKKVLAVPEGTAHTWLFSAPAFFTVIGLVVVAFVLMRMRRAAGKPAAA